MPEPIHRHERSTLNLDPAFVSTAAQVFARAFANEFAPLMRPTRTAETAVRQSDHDRAYLYGRIDERDETWRQRLEERRQAEGKRTMQGIGAVFGGVLGALIVAFGLWWLICHACWDCGPSSASFVADKGCEVSETYVGKNRDGVPVYALKPSC